MLFKRRKRTSHIERARIWAWPRVSWRRSMLYYAKRILRLSATPYAIASGCAIGAFASFTPLIGFHIVIAVALAWIIRGNLIAAIFGTAVGNPLTFPLIWASTYELGYVILRGEQAVAPPPLGRHFLEGSIENLSPIIKTMSIGSLPLGFLASLIVYAVVYKSVTAYQANRRHRLQGRRAAKGPAARKSARSQA